MSTTMNMEEQQPPAKKSRMDEDDPFSKEESAEIVIQNGGAEENEALVEKLSEAEERAQMAKNELEKIIQQQKNPEKLEALLANVIAILKEQQKEETTSSSGEPEIPQNSLDRHSRVPLPLELNCQIFECLKFGIQRKFIGGLGRGIYAIFRQKVLTKSKRLQNPQQNGWEDSNTSAIISFNGLYVSDNTGDWRTVVFAKNGFPITSQLSRPNNFPGTIVYYFEVTQIAKTDSDSDDFGHSVGLSDGNNSNGFSLGSTPNSYCFCGTNYYYLPEGECEFEWPNGVNVKVEYKDTGDTIGCGILLNPEDKVSIFSTFNGTLLGKLIPISPSVDCLYPTVNMCNIFVKANFGSDPAKPFEYNIEKCPGMGYDD